MMLSVLTYAIVSGVGGFATEAWQIGVLRFFAALGMGGEWSLGVALVNEIWPDRSRAFLAGLIGAAGNVGYLVIALVGRGLTSYVHETTDLLLTMGMPDSWASYLMGKENTGWRLLMMLAALPALLTFFIRVFVPESKRWEKERDQGATSHWANRDLLGVLIGSVAACGMIFLWVPSTDTAGGNILGLSFRWQVLGTLAGLAIIVVGYTYPVAPLSHACRPGQSRPGRDLAANAQTHVVGGLPEQRRAAGNMGHRAAGADMGLRTGLEDAGFPSHGTFGHANLVGARRHCRHDRRGSGRRKAGPASHL